MEMNVATAVFQENVFFNSKKINQDLKGPLFLQWIFQHINNQNYLVVSTHLKKYARQIGFIFPNFRR